MLNENRELKGYTNNESKSVIKIRKRKAKTREY